MRVSKPTQFLAVIGTPMLINVVNAWKVITLPLLLLVKSLIKIYIVWNTMELTAPNAISITFYTMENATLSIITRQPIVTLDLTTME